MHLVETYALQCGAKIHKPFIYETFFPIPIEKYITFQAQSQQNIDAKNYSYWQDVIDMIYPILLKNNISILQVGLPYEAPYGRVVDLRGATSINQLAYLMKGSLLHFGPDSFGIHLGSHYDIPIVALYSSTRPEIAGPYFSSKDKTILFKCYERVGNKKPSYALQENPKSINKILPEEIANAILKLLNINFVLPIQTVHLGDRYSNVLIRELIPNHPSNIGNPDSPVEVRIDKFLDEQLLAHHLNYLKKAILVTDKPINLNLLRYFKGNIPTIVYKIPEYDDIEFVRNVISIGIPIVLSSELPDDKLLPKKINYYEFGPITRTGVINEKIRQELLPKIDKLYFKSSKIVISQGQIFYSFSALDNNTPSQNNQEYQKAVDSPLFWRDLDFYTIVEKLDTPITT